MKKIFPLMVVIALLINGTFVTFAAKTTVENSPTVITSDDDYEDRYAVIIVGTYGSIFQKLITGSSRRDYYLWYTGSTQKMFNILTDEYSFKKENIYILLTEVNKFGYVPHDVFDPSSFHQENYMKSTEENIDSVFSEILKDKVDENDLLVVELIGHGQDEGYDLKTGEDSNTGLNAYDTNFPLEKPQKLSKAKSLIKEMKVLKKILEIRNGFNLFGILSDNQTITDNDHVLSEEELGDYTKSINSKRTIMILQPCHSGGFINSVSKTNHVVITSTEEGKEAGDFLGPLYKGLDYNREDADSLFGNNDGILALSESYNYAINNIPDEDGDGEADAYPLIDDNGDGIGHHELYAGNDGYFASMICELLYEC